MATKKHKKLEVYVSPDEYIALQQVALQFGYEWTTGNRVHQYNSHNPYHYLFFSENGVITHGTIPSDYVVKSVRFDEAILYITGVKTDKTQLFQIGEFNVTVDPGDSIQFGCTTLNKDQVESLIQAWQNKE